MSSRRLDFSRTCARLPRRDRTGLNGRFDIDVEFMPEPDAPAAALFTAFREQLGLRFQSATTPLDAYIVERVEPPTPG